MMTPRPITSILFLATVSVALLFACGTGPDDEGEAINPNIVKIKDCCIGQNAGGDLAWAVWNSDTIYTGNALRKIVIDNDFNVVKDSLLNLNGNPIAVVSPSLNDSGEKILFTKTIFSDVSSGSLKELNIGDWSIETIRDTSYHISSAVYWHGDDSKLVYYSYGNDQGLEAGYYLYNKTTDTDSLLLAHRSPIGPEEVINGFDLSPDNTTLLVPNVRASSTNPDGPQTPQIVEYNLQTQQSDTFDVSFDMSFVRVGLWLRYSPSGDRILYANYPLNAFGPTTNDDSEVGIVELPARTKRVLDANTNSGGQQRSVQLAPTWSPDGRHIVYGSGKLAAESGRRGSYSLYVLQNVDDSDNYINQP